MEQTEIVEIIRRELPTALEQNPELTDFVVRLTETRYARKSETNDRFYELLAELRRDREEQQKLTTKQDAKWEQERTEREAKSEQHRIEEEQYRKAQDEKWERHLEKQEEQRKEWAEEWKQHLSEQKLYREALEKKWEEERVEIEKRWAEQRELWKEQKQANIDNQRYHERLEQRVGAMGARWGTQSEKSFRNALKGILEEHFPIKVLNVSEFDEDGVVFGRPATIELDLIIKDGLLIICEIKSSLSVGDIFVFSKKAEFYQNRHKKKADKLIMISPMVDKKKARDLAKEIGIKIYSFAHEIEPEIS